MTPLFDYFNGMFDNQTALGWTLMIAGLTCVMSFFCALVSISMSYLICHARSKSSRHFKHVRYSLKILGVMDKRRETILNLEQDDGEVVRLRDLISFPAVFWFCSVVCLAYYVAIFPFISLGQVFFMKKFDMTSSEANFINGK